MSRHTSAILVFAAIVLVLSGMRALAAPMPAPADLTAGDPDDPAYAAYRSGYTHILDEHWKEARERFAEVISRHARSRYVVDAQYWSAYALGHLNRARAIKAYEQFLRDFPGTRYYDDAVADLAGLRLSSPVAPPVIDSLVMLVTPSVAPPPVIVHSEGPDLRRLQNSLRRMGHSLRRSLSSLRTLPESMGPIVDGVDDESALDERTRLKMQTLRALADHHEDDGSFAALRQFALDRTQADHLRLAALQSLSSYTKHDIMPTLVDVAQHDPDQDIRMTALLCIGAGTSGRAVDVLADLYTTIPPDRSEERQCVLDAVAEAGTDKGAAFLVRVARDPRHPDLQAAAIDYLGQMGDGRGKTVRLLRELYESFPPGEKEHRHSILFAVADIGDERAIDFLIAVARSSDDYDLRADAVYYLGNIGGERARKALYQILREK